jgi:hypothetical protein
VRDRLEQEINEWLNACQPQRTRAMLLFTLNLYSHLEAQQDGALTGGGVPQPPVNMPLLRIDRLMLPFRHISPAVQPVVPG